MKVCSYTKACTNLVYGEINNSNDYVIVFIYIYIELFMYSC